MSDFACSIATCTSPSVVSTSESVEDAEASELRESSSEAACPVSSSRAESIVCIASSKALRESVFAPSRRPSVSSPASLSASETASATCSVNELVICASSCEAPTSVIFGAIALAFSFT